MTLSSIFRVALAALPLVALAPSAQAQANFTFTGDNGASLLLTLTAPVTYTITTVPTASSPLILIDGLAGLLGSRDFLSSTLTYTVNGGTSHAINSYFYGASGIDFDADDAYIFAAPLPGVAAGDTVVLNAGTLTLSGAATPPPASASFTSFIMDDYGARISSDATAAAAPEPGSIALLLSAGIPVVGVVRRRKIAR